MPTLPAEARLVVRPLPGDAEPTDVLRRFAGDARVVVLTGRWAGGAGTGALLTSEPVVTVAPDEDPFAALSRQPVVAAGGPDGAVGGGWFGCLGYPLVRWVEQIPGRDEPELRPPALLGWYDHVLRRDVAGGWTFEALWTPERSAELDRRHALLADRLRTAAARPPVGPAGADRLRTTTAGAGGPAAGLAEPRATPFRGANRAGHLAAVERSVRHIRSGELFQVNTCLRLEAAFTGSVVELHARAAATLRPAYGALLTDAAGGLASLSPERFLRRRGRQVSTEPIKGTRPRTGTDDARQAELLARSAKDAAENVMIVDLMRNDLGRVCRPGSVRVPSLLRVEPHPGVWHLVSRVEGEPAAGTGDGELLRAVFPPGSVTGAPKVRAMEVIREVEPVGRDAYTGVIGFASPVWGMELSVAIRTFEVAGGTVRLGVGGGITVDSVPMEEWRECFDKATPLLAAAGFTLDPTLAAEVPPPVTGRTTGSPQPPTVRSAGTGPGRPPEPGRVPGPDRRPERGRGLRETVPVRRGRPVGLPDHLARLDRSCREVYGVPLPDGLADDAWRRCGELGDGVLRILAVPAGTGLRMTFGPTAAPPAGPAPLVPVTRPYGSWRHLWADRRWADDAEAVAGPGRLPLLVDPAGGVVGTTRGAVLLVEDGRLVTRPLDDDVLPGVTRLRLLDEAAGAGIPIAVEPVPLDRLLAADAVLTAGSIDGVRPVPAVGARRWPYPHPLVTDLLAGPRAPAHH